MRPSSLALSLLLLLWGSVALRADAAQRCETPAGATPVAVGELSPAAAALARGNRLLSEGAPAEALSAYEKSERLAREADGEPLALRAGANAARAAVEAGRVETAEAHLERVEAAVDGVADAGERAALRIHLARSWLRLAPLRRKPEWGRLRAAAILQRAAHDAEIAADARLFSYALGYRAELYAQAGQRDEAQALARRALIAAQQADAPDAAYRWHAQLGRLQRSAGDRGAALASYRQALAVLSEVRGQLAANAGGEVAFRAEVEPLYLELVDLLLRRAGEMDAEPRQALLAEARGVLEDLKAAELREYFRDPCLDAQRKASPDVIPRTLVVYPVLLPDRLELIVGASGQLERYAVPVGAEALEAEVRALRRTLEKRTTREYLRPARRLYDWLIRPLEPALARGEIDTLVFVPDRVLRTIPLAALHDRASGRFLIERYPVAITPGLTLTDPRAIDRGAVRLLAAGISESVQGYPALENVKSEMRAVTAAFPGEQLLDGSFRAARFEDEVTGRPFGIVHIASHGEFSADSASSYVLAYDEKISMDRIADWIATTRFRSERPLELLALSACQTAAGDERAALGLAGVALRAGARSALATLWSVNDRATAELVAEFYAQLEDPGRSRAEALQGAQVKLMHAYHFRHPAYWSPFLLISSWL
jgi:CHAT domain-containing protein